MFTISERAYSALASQWRTGFPQELARFIEAEFPEHFTPDGRHAENLAQSILARCESFNLTSRESILRYASAIIGNALNDPEGFGWIDDIMQDSQLDEDYKILFLEHKLYGRPLWAA
jgi:hypothetical protein